MITFYPWEVLGKTDALTVTELSAILLFRITLTRTTQFAR